MYRILVADDDEDVRELIEETLSRSGYTIEVVRNGPEALSRLKENPPDLLLLDVMLPGIDGYTVQLELAQSPVTRNIPVIILTALHSSEGLFQKFPQVQQFLSKPFEPADLLLAVERALGKK